MRFHPYWERDAGVSLVSPESGKLLASAYANDGKLLLAVLNDTNQTQAVTLALDLTRLGAEAGLKGHDVWQPERTYTLAETWEGPLGPRGFRLVLWAPSASGDGAKGGADEPNR